MHASDDHRGQHLLRRGYTRHFGPVNAELARYAGKVIDKNGFLLKVGQRDHGHIGDTEEFVASRHFYHRHMAQCTLGWEQPGFFVENTAHVLVGRHKAFHQYVGTVTGYERHSLSHALDVVFLVYDGEVVGVDTLSPACDDNTFAVAEEGGVYKSFSAGIFYCMKGVGVVGAGYSQPTAASAAGGLYDLL